MDDPIVVVMSVRPYEKCGPCSTGHLGFRSDCQQTDTQPKEIGAAGGAGYVV